MSANDSEKFYLAYRRHSSKLVLPVLLFLIVLSLAANAYQYLEAQRSARNMAAAQRGIEAQIASMHVQITRLSEATSGAFDVTQQRFINMEDDLRKATAETLRQATSEVKSQDSKWAEGLERRSKEFERNNQEALAQFSRFKQETNAKLDRLSNEVAKNGSDLKRIAGTRAAASSDPPKIEAREAPALKPVADREYLPFDLVKTKVPQRIGDISVALRKADPKEGRFSLDVYADQKIVEHGDHAVDEPMRLYFAGSPVPYEIVVTEVKKDEVIGHIAAPKLKVSRAQTVGNISAR
jgi:hypothetical protein